MSLRAQSQLFHIRNSVHHPRFVAHRGFTVDGPENSLQAFMAAGAKRFWAIETDVHMTLDGVLVCNHDSTIDAMYDGTGEISKMTWKEIQQYTMNSGNNVETFPAEQRKMPTFEQYLRICRYYGSVPFIELKTGVVEDVLEVVKKYDLEDFSVISTRKIPWLRRTRELSDRIYVHHILSNMETAQEIRDLGHSGLQLDYADVTLVPEADVQRLHELGLNVCIRCQDTEETAKYAIEIGMDYVPTNVIAKLNNDYEQE